MSVLNTLIAQNVLTAVGGQDAQGGQAFKDGEQVPVRVLDSPSDGKFSILVKGQRMTVSSTVPLQVGARLFAEILVRDGIIHLVIRPDQALPQDAASGQLQGPLPQASLSSLFRNLMGAAPSTPGLGSELRSWESLRQAFRDCGMFYEAKLLAFMRAGRSFQFLNDLKGFLLHQLRQQMKAPLQEAATGVLRHLEGHQLTGSQAGPDGPVFFWLPFGRHGVIEGFVKRKQTVSGPRLLVTCRVPFVEAEELRFTLVWQGGKGQVHFAPGPLGEEILRDAVGELAQQLKEKGFTRITLHVSKVLPQHVLDEMQGIRFVESYG